MPTISASIGPCCKRGCTVIPILSDGGTHLSPTWWRGGQGGEAALAPVAHRAAGDRAGESPADAGQPCTRRAARRPVPRIGGGPAAGRESTGSRVAMAYRDGRAATLDCRPAEPPRPGAYCRRRSARQPVLAAAVAGRAGAGHRVTLAGPANGPGLPCRRWPAALDSGPLDLQPARLGVVAGAPGHGHGAARRTGRPRRALDRHGLGLTVRNCHTVALPRRGAAPLRAGAGAGAAHR